MNMQATTNINVRVDSLLKAQAEEIFSELGLTLSAAVTVFLRNAVRYRGIPFELRLETPGAAPQGTDMETRMEDCNTGGSVFRLVNGPQD